MKTLNTGRSRIPPIQRQKLIRKFDLWSRKQPSSPPKFLEITSDDPGIQFELPIDIAGVQLARETDGRQHA